MPVLAFSPRAYSREGYGVPSARLQNYYTEKYGEGFILIRRPGLLSSTTFTGSGPIRGVYSQTGVFSGDTFAVVGNTLYRGAISLGPVIGTGRVTWAASTDQLVVTGGGVAYCYEAGVLAAIIDPDLPPVSGVALIAGRFVYAIVDSDTFYYSDVNDATSIDGLSFATAEGWPDPNLGVFTYGDELVFPGASTVEFWSATGDADAPFAKTQLRRFMQGVVSFASIVLMDNSFYFVGKGEQGLAVFKAGNVPEAVSDPGVADALQACTTPADITAYTVGFGGHLFYVVNIPGQTTFAYDVTTKLWGEWTSDGRTTFRGACALMIDGAAYIGDDTDATIWKLDKATFTDGTDQITKLASAFRAVKRGRQPHDRVMLQCARGVGLTLGQGSDPIVELRYSDDAGRTWCPWKPRKLGAIGRYSDRAIWEEMGEVSEPGRAYELRVTDPVGVTFVDLVYGERFS